MVNLDIYHYLALNETNCMIDMSFEGTSVPSCPTVRSSNRLCSSVPLCQKGFRTFARSALVKPVTINVEYTGSPRLEVEYLGEEAKMTHLLECLQKTAPPVLILVEKRVAINPPISTCC